MDKPPVASDPSHRSLSQAPLPRKQHRNRLRVIVLVVLLVAVAVGWFGWVAYKANLVRTEMAAAVALVPQLKVQVASSDITSIEATVHTIDGHTSAARQATEDPFWVLASGFPLIGANLNAVAEVSRSADDVVKLALIPLSSVYTSLDWEDLLPNGKGADLGPMAAASPKITAAAYAVRGSSDRLNAIETRGLLPQIAEPVESAAHQLRDVTGALDAAADVSSLAPSMMGSSQPKNYLLMIQNNAEARATGGIPGALAVLTFDQGKLKLGEQSSAGDVGIMSPVVSVDPQQEQIYSRRLGKYLQDVNLTPSFPTAAATAQTMWERKTGQRVDGVLSIDPVVLSYLLKATGPVSIKDPALTASVKAEGLPAQLNEKNVVQTLLSDVYAKIAQPHLQDAYFAGVAKEVFDVISEGQGDAKGLLASLTRGAEEGRVLIWSADATEQSVISEYPVSGSITGPSVAPAQFGVYFNDGTGAKMDYYIERRVQLVRECPADGYEQTIVRVTSTNKAPADAETSLPDYVTGGGAFGVPPGVTQTNIVVYGPVQALVETARADGQRTDFAPYFHSGRPVGVLAQQLEPGETKTVEFTFGKIVQHAEPNVVVTPTVQPKEDVVLATQNAECG